MLVKKGRLDLGRPAGEWLTIASKHPAWRSLELDEPTALSAVNLPGELHPDPADRFLIAAARVHGLAIMTADKAILDYAKAGHVLAEDASR